MLPGLPTYKTSPCVLVGGVLDGKEDTLSWVCDWFPCDVKKYLYEGRIIDYCVKYLDVGTKDQRWEEDEGGRIIMYYKNGREM